MNTFEDLTRSNEVAWDRAAQKYAPDVEQDIAFLREGGVALYDVERRVLGDLSRCDRAVHLQCSHGTDALSLLNLGVSEVVGVDISRTMLAQAEQKTERLDARATWVHADVLDLPAALDGSASLIYTGKGALPWVHDIDQWAGVVRRLLQPGGQLYVFEGHPLNGMWEREAPVHRLHPDGRGYFDGEPKVNEDFPARAVARFTTEGEPVAEAWEWQWTVGEVVTAVAEAGLVVERLEEHPEHFWPQFERIEGAEAGRLPRTFSLLARLPAA